MNLNIKEEVKKGYSKIAQGNCSCSCQNKKIAASIGYNNEDIEELDNANLGLGCGNPVALSNMKAGDTVLDLGSGAGCFSIGHVDAVNVLTMFEKADLVIHSMSKQIKQKELNLEEKEENHKALASFYKDTCNSAHINFNAHLCVGKLVDGSLWEIRDDLTNYKKDLWGFYMPHFSTSIACIKLFLSRINRHEKVNHFDLLDNIKYFL